MNLNEGLRQVTRTGMNYFKVLQYVVILILIIEHVPVHTSSINRQDGKTIKPQGISKSQRDHPESRLQSQREMWAYQRLYTRALDSCADLYKQKRLISLISYFQSTQDTEYQNPKIVTTPIAPYKCALSCLALTDKSTAENADRKSAKKKKIFSKSVPCSDL